MDKIKKEDIYPRMFDMMTGHTPTPWAKSGSTIIDLETGLTICEIEDMPAVRSELNAAFIVRAMNCHEELLESLKALAHIIRKGPDKLPPAVFKGVQKELLSQAEKVIAKAEGK